MDQWLAGWLAGWLIDQALGPLIWVSGDLRWSASISLFVLVLHIACKMGKQRENVFKASVRLFWHVKAWFSLQFIAALILLRGKK